MSYLPPLYDSNSFDKRDFFWKKQRRLLTYSSPDTSQSSLTPFIQGVITAKSTITDYSSSFPNFAYPLTYHSIIIFTIVSSFSCMMEHNTFTSHSIMSVSFTITITYVLEWVLIFLIILRIQFASQTTRFPWPHPFSIPLHFSNCHLILHQNRRQSLNMRCLVKEKWMISCSFLVRILCSCHHSHNITVSDWLSLGSEITWSTTNKHVLLVTRLHHIHHTWVSWVCQSRMDGVLLGTCDRWHFKHSDINQIVANPVLHSLSDTWIVTNISQNLFTRVQYSFSLTVLSFHLMRIITILFKPLSILSMSVSTSHYPRISYSYLIAHRIQVIYLMILMNPIRIK